MHLLSEEKAQILARRYGWSVARADGYCKGEAARRYEETPSVYSMVGIDEFALGFRAGYFVRDGSRRPPETAMQSAPGRKQL